MQNQIDLSDIDLKNKLEIKFNNIKPIELNDLSLSLLSIGNQYQKFIENDTNDSYKVNSELFIKEVRTGSIIIELVAQAMPVVPLLWSGGSLVEWTSQASSTFQWLLGKVNEPPIEVSKQDLKQWNCILEPIAKDNGSQLNFTVSDGGTVINNFYINSEQANAAQNSIKRRIESLNEPDDHLQAKRVMYWYQTKFDDESHTGDKAVIESISKKPVKVIFENNAVKKAMLKGDARFIKPWNELAYLVDVRVQTVRDEPKVYTIINYFEDETFDPEI
ncbi:MAG: hypothetical protein PSV17_11260 [Methylotenera sp.]|uniref:hypothetical protein n=1 Tax=Methylotenera sp. TaxID=2051956 RepID=UPI00248954CE|nr:hypothetical protein [Methylotenera sp.]MDI1309991.1 hypothetical protein [Methylotenera sp.]